MKILVVNLTRFGDLLQSQPIISGLADQGHSVGLACLEHFAPAAVLLSNLACVAPFPGSVLLRELEGNWSASLTHLFNWRQEIYRVFNPNLVVNLTPSLSARMLTRYLSLGRTELKDEKNVPTHSFGGEAKLVNRLGKRVNCSQAGLHTKNFIGFGVDEFGFGLNSSPWSTYLQASSRMRGNSPYNLVDLFRKICNLGAISPRYNLCAELGAEQKELAEQMRRAAFEVLSQAGEAPPITSGGLAPSSFGSKNLELEKLTQNNQTQKGFVAFQLGASDDRRRWPTGYFAELGSLFWQKYRLMPVLMGSKDEKHLGDKYKSQATSPFINLIGATNLPGLGAALNQCAMLITNDTGTMHLAAGLNVPTLALFLATAQPWDTAPYQADVCCLEPNLADHPRPFDDSCPPGCACRHLIEPATLFELADLRLGSGTWELPGTILGRGQARVWLTVRKNKNVDPEGFLDLKSLSGHEFAERTTWLRMQRYFLRKLLDNDLEDFAKKNSPKELPDELGERASQLTPQFLQTVTGELEQAAALLHLLCEQGAVLQHNPIEMIKTRFMATWQRLQSLWDNSVQFNVLGLLWMAQTQEQGDDLQVVLDLAGRYRLLCQKWLELLAAAP